MTVLYPNLCYNEVCYKGTALYMSLNLRTGTSMQLVRMFGRNGRRDTLS